MDDEVGQQGEAIVEECRIDTAFETGAGIRGETELAAGNADPLRIEIGDLEQDIGGAFVGSRMFAAHDAANVVHALLVRDDGHGLVERIGLLVQRLDGFAILRPPRNDGPGKLAQIVDMRRAPGREHEVIGAIDECADRALSGSLEAALQPVGRRPVLHAADDAAVISGHAVDILDAYLDGAGALALDHRHIDRLERTQPSSSKVAGDAHHPHAIGTVGRDRHIEHR